MIAILTGHVTSWILYHLQAVRWSEVWGSALTSSLAVILLYVTTFVYYWFKRNDLEDPPRRLSHKQRRKIVEHLSPYGTAGGKRVRIIRLNYYPHVHDAPTLGDNIRETLEKAGWAADIADTDAVSEDQRHSHGLWIYGEGKYDPSPLTLDLIQDAFTEAGIPIHVDNETWGEQGTCMVIGRRE